MSGGKSPSEGNIWTPILVALIGAAAAILVGYWQFARKDERTEFVGRVVNAKTETGIRNAKITLEVEGAPPIMYADSEGVFNFSVKSSSSLVRIRVEADGYEKFDRLITPSNKTGMEKIELFPKAKSNLTKPISTAVLNNNLPKSVDYSQLRKMLSNRKFKEADEETNRILLQLTGNDSFNDVSDAARIDCVVYQTIDSLWREYSKDKFGNSKFGFSVQRRIFQNAENIVNDAIEMSLKQCVEKAMSLYDCRSCSVGSAESIAIPEAEG